MTIAFWCVLIAALLPYVAFGLVSSNSTLRRRASALPNSKVCRRAPTARTSTRSRPLRRSPRRSLLLISSKARARRSIGLRSSTSWPALGHLGFYLGDRQPLRSAAFFLGLLVTIIIFVQPAFH